jgi:hypothetical protein
MDKLEIKSKVLAPASKKYTVVAMILKVALIICTCLILLMLLIGEFEIRELGTIIIGLILLKYLESVNKSDFQSLDAELEIKDDSMTIEYWNVRIGNKYCNMRILAAKNDIQSIEYNNALKAYKINGNIKKQVDGSFKLENMNSWVLYDEDNTYNVKDYLEGHLGLNINYVDNPATDIE